jgi:phage FluMu gp28-like protein
MLIVTKTPGEDLAGWLATEEGFISAFCRYDDAPIVLEPFQRAFVRNPAKLRWVIKSRQVGLSFVLALEALARCALRTNYSCIFVSFSLEEAKERVLLARQVYEELPLAYKKRLIVDTKTELAFESTGRARGISRIISVPAKPPRGRRGDVIIDELAHVPFDREVYAGSTALILRSHGQLTGCSTPLGRRGIFHEIACETTRAYRHHTRQWVPWWLSRLFCTDVPRAAREAPAMSSEERVHTFGAPGLVTQFDSLPLDDFKQEFELDFLDGTLSFLPVDLILGATTDDLVLAADVTDLPAPRGRLVAGFDVGRTHDRSVLAVFEALDDRFLCRMLRVWSGMPFDDQVGELRRLLTLAPIARLTIDSTGLGMHLAENLARDFPQVEPEPFTNEAKERWALQIKILLQQQNLVLPRDRRLVGEFHAIKRRVLPSGKIAYDAERTAAGHADRFWAIALACQRERGGGPKRAAEVGVRVIG